MELTEKVLNEIVNNRDWPMETEINGIKYFIKPDDDLEELIGYYFARFLNIPCASYELIDIEGDYYIASKDLNHYGKFTTIDDLINVDFEREFDGNMYQLFEFLEKNYPDSKKLKKQAIMVYIYDILFLNVDRNVNNWGILETDNSIDIVIIDNQCIFSAYDEETPPVLTVEPCNDMQESIVYDVKWFFEEFPDEDKVLFLEVMKLLEPKNVLNMMNKIEKDNDVIIENKKFFYKVYCESYRRVNRVIKYVVLKKSLQDKCRGIVKCIRRKYE